MAKPVTTLHLLIPGLLGPMPMLADLETPPDLSRLERLLSRADQRSVDGCDYESTLLSFWGFYPNEWEDLPLAALRRLADGGVSDDRVWAQINPVHLKPDQDRLLMFDMEEFVLSMDEAQVLAQLFKEHYADMGWQLEVAKPHRWYLSLSGQPQITTSELSAAFGRNIESFLPQGNEALSWHALLNEIQMLFASASINQQRMQDDKFTVNGAWLSGIGAEPAGLTPPFSAIYADEVLAKGIAMASGVTPQPVSSTGSASAQPTLTPDIKGDHLTVYDGLQRSVLRSDPFDWSEATEALQQWLTPIIQGLGNNWQRLIIYPCQGEAFEVTPGNQRRFWRRAKPYPSFMLQN